MSSGSIQIAAQGMQDVYLNGTPEVSYFTGVFRRHSTFLLQTAEYPFDTPVQFGGLGKVKIPYRGDLLIGTTLKVVLPPLYTPGQGWVYPLATNSDYVPWINDQPTLAKIRTNLPTFKTYFSDGANTIAYINRSVAYYNTYSPYSASITSNLAFSNVTNYPITYSSTPLNVQPQMGQVTLSFVGSYGTAPYSTSQVVTAVDESVSISGPVTACTTTGVTISVNKVLGSGVNQDWEIGLFSQTNLMAAAQTVTGLPYQGTITVNQVGASTVIVKSDQPQNITVIISPISVDFNNGASKICRALVTSRTRTVPQLIRLICIQSTNPNSIQSGYTVQGLPYTGRVEVYETFTSQEYTSNGVSFSYNTIDVVSFVEQIIQPITSLTSVTFFNNDPTPLNIASAKIISPSSIPWIRNDFMYVTYDPIVSGFVWKTIYPLVKPISSVYMNVSNTNPISIGMNITGLSTLTGNVTVGSLPVIQIVTPIKMGSAEYFSLPTTISIKLLYSDSLVSTANVAYVQYPSDIDYSIVNTSFTDYRFSNGNRLVYTSNNNQLGTITGVTGYQNNQILTILDQALPPPQTFIPVSIYNNLNLIAVANATVNNATYITSTNFGPSVFITNVTVVSGLVVNGLPVQTTDVKTQSNSFSSNIITATFSAQSVVPISTSLAVTFSNLTASVSGSVGYSYFTNPVTISKLAFPSQQSCVFWGFDPATVTFSGSR